MLFYAEEGEAAQLSNGALKRGGKGGNERGMWSLSGLRATTAPAPAAAPFAASSLPSAMARGVAAAVVPVAVAAEAEEAEEAEPFVPLGSRVEARIIRDPPS